jgi:ketosteroid isomerase-like protein
MTTSHTVTASPERVIESVAYDTAERPYRGCSVRASYLKDSQHAWIEITRDGKVIRGYEYPAYRIYNIAAHFNEYVDDLLSDDPQGGGK